MTQHEISEGFIRLVGRNYFMRLVVDGQKKQRSTGTNDPDKAAELLAEWKAEERAGIQADTRQRYEAIRDHYIEKGGKSVQASILRDLDEFFKDIRVSAITVKKLEQFREWRENQKRVLEYQGETLEKEITLRTMKATTGRRKSLSASEQEAVRKDATEWVENGVKATTDKRLTILRAMFNFAKERELINDVPYFPILGTKVDNKKEGFFERDQFEKLMKRLPEHLHQFINFLYATGMRSGQAAKLTWDMVSADNKTLTVPARLTKNKEDFSLPLTYQDGTTIKGFEFRERKRQAGEVLFNTINFRAEWRTACHELKLGVVKGRTYRGMEPHDFRRTACRDMVKAGIPEVVSMKISGHKTNSMFKRYAITDHRMVQSAFQQMHTR
ncbi:MAG TPA: site-specific integrase [Candidatus Limnocylindria bacterium]|nr:site-specific integrase [Candidatus Limnocylindria bacterium]